MESIGGFDMFQTTVQNDSVWETPKNLGYPLNSTGDDAHISVSWFGGIAYFTRENPEHAGDFDICYANLPGFNIRANINRFQIKNYPEDTPVYITLLANDLSQSLGVFNVNADGEFTLVLLPDEKGILEIRAAGYRTIRKELKFKETQGLVEFKEEVELMPMLK